MKSIRALAKRMAASPRNYTILLASILLWAFAARVAVRAYLGPAGFWEDGYSFYLELSRSVASGAGYVFADGLPGTFRPPLYTLFLAALTGGKQAFWQLLLAQALVSTGTVACAAGIAHRLFGRSAALVAAAVTAFYPYYVVHDTALQETGLFTFFTALAMLLLLLARERDSLVAAAAAGLALGLAILTRSTVAPFALFAAGWLLLARADTGERLPARLGRSVVFAALVAAAVLPWASHLREVTGRWGLSGNTGYALFMGNNPQTFAYYPTGSIDQSMKLALASLSPADQAQLPPRREVTARDDWFMRKGMDYIGDSPARFAANAVRKNVAAFGIVPSPRGGTVRDMLGAMTYGPILLLGLLGAWRFQRARRVHALFYGQFALFMALTGVLWGHWSHRAFLDVYLIVFASALSAPWLTRLLAEPD